MPLPVFETGSSSSRMASYSSRLRTLTNLLLTNCRSPAHNPGGRFERPFPGSEPSVLPLDDPGEGIVHCSRFTLLRSHFPAIRQKSANVGREPYGAGV